ncbi:MAG: hypothetical protein WCO64_07535 [Actinomycetes bacterium]
MTDFQPDSHNAEELKNILRKALADLDLDPDETADDMAIRQSQDKQLQDDVPPHHSEH